jgi:hypothetical protein
MFLNRETLITKRFLKYTTCLSTSKMMPPFQFPRSSTGLGVLEIELLKRSENGNLCMEDTL